MSLRRISLGVGANAYDKLGARHRTEALARANELKLL